MTLFTATASATIDGAGTATAIVTGPPPGRLFELARLSVTIPGESATAIIPCRVYVDAVSPAGLVSATRTGQLDTDDQPQAQLAPGQQLVVQWTGATPGLTATVNVGYRQVSL